MWIEAAAKKWEREHNARVWLAWHIAALQRMKKLPDIKKLLINNTSRPRQTWRQQLQIFSEWANRRNAWLEKQKAMTDGSR